ncbi:MAG: carboxypeptidase regulatory-like domain-containing protein [Hyphomicrobiales bacterium]
MIGARRLGPALSAVAALALLTGATAARPALAAGRGEIRGGVTSPSSADRRETIVYVKRIAGRYAPKTAVLDQRGMRFVPHVLLITRGDTVRFLNHDDVPHNVFSLDHERYNLGTFTRGQTRSRVFSESLGVYTQYCSIHPGMTAYIFVGQNPYAARVDARGRYVIRGVPPGRYTLEVWNPHLAAPARPITVTNGGVAHADFALHG